MNNCLFCGIVDGKVKANLVYQDDFVVAFKDIAPKAPVHILIIPRQHLVSVSDIAEQDHALIGQIFQVAARLACEQGIADSGFRVVVNSGADAGQSVFHLHYHLLGGRQMSWPPG
ncbi:MAG TPA: histidine triad nucleotide-binding protein [Candidatus Limnocylindrales bacterium]|nr:histidine triad nucleotide-binding protein [Candidatus Limnocylindrales bacterium]